MAEIRRVRHGGDATLLVLESTVVLGVAGVVCYSQSHQIYHWLMTALPRGQLPATGQLDPMLLAVPLLAVLGIVAGWAVVVPLASRQLVTLDSDVILRASDHVDFTMGILLASGIGGARLGAFALRRAA